VNVLGFDTSTAATSACLLREDGEAFERVPDPGRLFERPGHAAELLPAIDWVMQEAGVGWADVAAIGVGIGPGTFTGLRIGIATARALAHSTGIELRPVSSLAALAAGIDAPARLPLIDAKRGEVFAALYEDGTELWEPFAAAPGELAGRLGEAPANPVAAGDGSLRFSEVLEAAGVTVAPRESRAHVVRAIHVCRLAAGARAELPEAVLPLYLRGPDAIPRHE
jgi:tRNA threonylcarbamoyladenosine biosynthesis protein TsaB